MDKKTKDTLFIDMKYIILYRKLGFCEVFADVFEYHYADTTIRIESEKQKYVYCGQEYPLLAYKDFVILECLDRLLKKGYPSRLIRRDTGGYDIAILKDSLEVYCGIFAEQWGTRFEKLSEQFCHTSKNTECLYTSQLFGGLVDFVSKIFSPNGEYSGGIFEEQSVLYGEKFFTTTSKNTYSIEFTVKEDELVKYLGQDKTVRIPDGITRIGAGAFWDNHIVERIDLPETVTCICGDAFVYCENLKKVNIPASVNAIGDDPFAGCLDIKIDNQSSRFIVEDGVLFDKQKKTLIHYTASNPEKVYIIPESVEWIGKHSFYKCQNLECVTINKNVKFMGNNAFSDCRNIQLKNESAFFHYIDGVLYDRNKSTCMHYSMGSGVKVVILESTVRTIGRNCFWNCDMIEKIVIPESVRQIGYNPFANCKNVTIENHSPFYRIIDGILYDASVKELVFCPPSAAKYGKIILPNTLVNIGRNAFSGCVALTDIVLPNGLKYISRGAFSGCVNLKEIKIPLSVEDIADWCFDNCTNLRTAYIPKHLQLAPNTFNGCTAECVRI